MGMRTNCLDIVGHLHLWEALVLPQIVGRLAFIRPVYILKLQRAVDRSLRIIVGSQPDVEALALDAGILQLETIRVRAVLQLWRHSHLMLASYRSRLSASAQSSNCMGISSPHLPRSCPGPGGADSRGHADHPALSLMGLDTSFKQALSSMNLDHHFPTLQPDDLPCGRGGERNYDRLTRGPHPCCGTGWRGRCA